MSATATADGKKASAFGRYFLVIFGLVFFGGGLAAGYFLVFADLRDWQAAQGYVSAPATLRAVELKRHRSDKSTTYSVRATYLYDYQGRRLVGHRVGISDGADNIGDYQRVLYARLNAALQRGDAVTAWVDPADPRQVLLDRDMRWGLFAFKSLLAVMFTLAGSGIALFGLRVRTGAAAAWTVPVLPDGRIASNNRAAMWGWWVFAVFWNLVSSPAWVVLPHELAKGGRPAFVLLLFPIAGIALLYQAVHATLRWRRFGAAALALAPCPGAVGGTVTGSIDLPERFRAVQAFRVVMTCVRRRTTGSGRDRGTTDTAIWQDETRPRADAGGRCTRLTFAFNVPGGLPPSSAPSNDYVHWTVDINADLPGVDLDSHFEIPMIAAAGAATPAAGVPAVAIADAVAEIPARIVRIFHDRGATVFYYPLFRYPVMGVGLLLFSLIFAVPVGLMSKQLHGGLMDAMLWMMIAVFGVVGTLLFAASLYLLGNSLRVEISPRGLTTVRRVYGLGFSRHVALDAVKSVEAKIGSQTNRGGTISVRYRLVVHTDDGRKITVGDAIPGHPLAEHLAQRLRDACGLRR